MPIHIKRNGTYAAVSAAYAKRSGAYQSAAVSLKRAGAYVSAGGGSPGITLPLNNPPVAYLGDSNTQFCCAAVGINTGTTLSRDAAGLVTLTKTNHGLFGVTQGFIGNLLPGQETYGGFYTFTATGTNTLTYQTTTTGAAGSIAPSGGAFLTTLQRGSGVDWTQWIDSTVGGGLRNVGNFGQASQPSYAMTAALGYAIANAPQIVFILAGTNDIFAFNRTSQQVLDDITALATTAWAAGCYVVLLSVPPVTTAASYYTAPKQTIADDANTKLAALAAANSTRCRFVNFATLLKSGADGDPQYFVSDGVHVNERGAKLIGTTIGTDLVTAGVISNTSPLPTSSSDSTIVNGWQTVRSYGPWTATGGGAASNVTGTINNDIAITRFTAGTAVASLTNDGVGFGYSQNVDFTSDAVTAGSVSVFGKSSSGESLATLTLAVGDIVRVVAELEILDPQTGKFVGYELRLNTNGSGSFGICTAGSATAGLSAAAMATSYPRFVLKTGPLTIVTGTTVLVTSASFRFLAESTTSSPLKVRRLILQKKVA